MTEEQQSEPAPPTSLNRWTITLEMAFPSGVQASHVSQMATRMAETWSVDNARGTYNGILGEIHVERGVTFEYGIIPLPTGMSAEEAFQRVSEWWKTQEFHAQEGS